MQFETWLETDLAKTLVVKKLAGSLFSGDANANQIGASVYRSGEPETLSGAISGYIILPDGQTVVTTGTRNGNRAWIVLPASAYTQIGIISIVIKAGDVAIAACSATVYRSTTDAIIDPGSVVPDISQLLQAIADCEAATEAAREAAEYANIMSYGEIQRALDKAFVVGKIEAAIRRVENNSKAKVIYNDGNATDDAGILAHSICPIFVGGVAAKVAAAIKPTIPEGVATYGNLQQTVDGVVIKLQRATTIDPTISITVTARTGYDDSVASAIKAAVVAFVGAQDIGQELVIADLAEAIQKVSSTFTVGQVVALVGSTTYTTTLPCGWNRYIRAREAYINITS